jgi:hypothetical protein
MSSRSSDPVADLKSALAISVGGDGRVSRPLDVLGLIRPASLITSPEKDRLFARIYLEAPLPYWLIVNWARKLTPSDLPALLAETLSEGWNCVRDSDPAISQTPQGILREVAERFHDFDPRRGSWQDADGQGDENPPQRQKYVLGRDLARTYVRGLAGLGDNGQTRAALLLDQQAAWHEWIEANLAAGHSAQAVCEATAIGLDHIVSRDITPGVNGIGRAHVLLEEMSVSRNPAMGVMNASIFPIDPNHPHLDGLLIPDLREIGVLGMSPEFLIGVEQAWNYVRSISPWLGPSMLCFSVRPSTSTVLQKLSGTSAEAATLAAIESAVGRRVLRADAAASARLTLFTDGDAVGDPEVGPASFEDKKFFAAVRHRLRTIVVHRSVAEDWKLSQQRVGISRADGEPDVVASEFYRRDVEGVLETRSQWRLAYRVPGAITLAFVGFATLFWQLYKMSASPLNAVALDPDVRMPFVMPALVGSEMVSLTMCIVMVLICQSSISRSLDSPRSSWLSLLVCGAIVLLAQFVPIGVRYEGLLDNPYYSVLFGEPQVSAQQVIEQGGAGLLILHAVSQSTGFVTILFGVSASAIRLIQTRAHSEPIYGDRCELIRNDWYFSLLLLGFYFVVVTVFCLARNTLWYYYLATLPEIQLIQNQGSFWAVVGPLLGISVVLAFSVFCVWLYILNAYLVRVVTSARGRSGYTAEDVIATMPRLARWIYYAKPAE